VNNEKIVFLEQYFQEGQQLGSVKKNVGSYGVGKNSGRPMDSFRALLAQQGVGGGKRGVSRNSAVTETVTEGRWNWIAIDDSDSIPDQEKNNDLRMAAWAALLMQRYGVVCREVVNFAAPGLAWSDLADWLEAAEWRGEVRRGYFVEGLSGVQYTTDDTSGELVLFCDRIATGSGQSGLDPSIHLVSAIDPANVYGATAPLDLPLVDGGRARLPRIIGNSLVLVDGRPVWIIQERGKRLTSLPHASEAVRQQALRHFVRNFTGISTKWTIIAIDDAPPVTTEWSEVLGELGFVHDGLSMTMYRGLT
jgi:ATP-dependent Lhr-like helicase